MHNAAVQCRCAQLRGNISQWMSCFDWLTLSLWMCKSCCVVIYEYQCMLTVTQMFDFYLYNFMWLIVSFANVYDDFAVELAIYYVVDYSLKWKLYLSPESRFKPTLGLKLWSKTEIWSSMFGFRLSDFKTRLQHGFVSFRFNFVLDRFLNANSAYNLV